MVTVEFVTMFLVHKSCSVVVISVVDMDLRLKHPFCGLLSGGTGCGKLVFTFKLISEAQRMITPPPEISFIAMESFRKFSTIIRR
jgi:hypothetical protein